MISCHEQTLQGERTGLAISAQKAATAIQIPRTVSLSSQQLLPEVQLLLQENFPATCAFPATVSVGQVTISCHEQKLHGESLGIATSAQEAAAANQTPLTVSLSSPQLLSGVQLLLQPLLAAHAHGQISLRGCSCFSSLGSRQKEAKIGASRGWTYAMLERAEGSKIALQCKERDQLSPMPSRLPGLCCSFQLAVGRSSPSSCHQFPLQL